MWFLYIGSRLHWRGRRRTPTILAQSEQCNSLVSRQRYRPSNQSSATCSWWRSGWIRYRNPQSTGAPRSMARWLFGRCRAIETRPPTAVSSRSYGAHSPASSDLWRNERIHVGRSAHPWRCLLHGLGLRTCLWTNRVATFYWANRSWTADYDCVRSGDKLSSCCFGCVPGERRPFGQLSVWHWYSDGGGFLHGRSAQSFVFAYQWFCGPVRRVPAIFDWYVEIYVKLDLWRHFFIAFQFWLLYCFFFRRHSIVLILSI